ncbi:MAG: D-glucuronyl C5-epimerase family protein [Crocinitomicaceae bacterium]|nr:D-glucuronyl C5-epimerase family protein [Crocinitomicaceae bacterium]
MKDRITRVNKNIKTLTTVSPFFIVGSLLVVSCFITSCETEKEESEVIPPPLNCNFSDLPQSLDSCNYLDYKTEDFTITALEYDKLPYIYGFDKMRKAIFDSDSIPIFEFKGEKHYHPIVLAQYCLELLDAFNTTNDSSLLTYTEKLTAKLLELPIETDSSLLFPYMFEFEVHQCPDELMEKGWYSSMAQGQVLSLLCRLDRLTGNENYRSKAEMTFNSLKVMKGTGQTPWMSCVDPSGNLWFEEYPNDIPFHTLNGMIFTLYGFYDYYLMTGDETSKKLLQAGILTIKTNIYNFRNEGSGSYYCLKHRLVSNPYHQTHINQLKILYLITQDPFFDRAVKDFESDM